MSDKKNLDKNLDPDDMILHARSLRSVAQNLESAQTEQVSDGYLFQGKMLAVTILLSLATEIALKALKCRESNGTPLRSHDLLKLFKNLKKDTRELLVEKMPERRHPDLPHPHFPPMEKSLRDVLCEHRDSFEHYRYLYEDYWGQFETSEVQQALNVIIETYYNWEGESKST